MFGYIKTAAISPRVHIACPRKNADEIVGAVLSADKAGVTVAVFPELSVTGYTCGDLFLQSDLLDAYYNTVSLGIKTLVSGEYAKVENVLYGMTSINWATFDNIGDQSGRVREFDRM